MIYDTPGSSKWFPKSEATSALKKSHFGARVKRTSLWQNLGKVWVNRIHVESFFRKQNHNVGTQTPGQKHSLCNTIQDKPFFCEDSRTLSKPFNRKLWVILLIERNYAPVNKRYSFSLTLRIFVEIIPGCLSDFFLQRVIWRSYQRGTASIQSWW